MSAPGGHVGQHGPANDPWSLLRGATTALTLEEALGLLGVYSDTKKGRR